MESVSIDASSFCMPSVRKESLSDKPFRVRLSLTTVLAFFFTGRSALPFAQANKLTEMSNMMKDFVLVDVHIFILCANVICKELFAMICP